MRIPVIAVLLLACSTAIAPASAQTLCDGKKVSAVMIQRSERTIMDKARAPGWSRALLQPLLLGATTRNSAIRPFLQLVEGGDCSERRRSESERVLRLQPYIADATVRTVDEPDGRVRVEVETVDDLRPILGLGLRGTKVSNAELGNSSVAGTGHLVAVNWRDGRVFRDGFGLRYTDYHFLGRPARANLVVQRQPLGTFLLASLARPFFTDLQHSAAFAGFVRDDGYVGFVRPEGDALSLSAVRERADVGGAFRLGLGGSTRVLLGALASFERRRAAAKPVIITDSGFVQTTDLTLVDRYKTTDATQVGLVTGVRAISFVKAKGFDALEGIQDVGRGIQLATTVGTSVRGSQREPFLTGDMYVGAGTAKAFVGLRTQVESRRRDGQLRNMVGSGRLALYLRPSPRVTQLLSVEYAGALRQDVPFQLTIDDPLSGARGYAGSRLAGGRLVVARAEHRIVLPGISNYLGWGVAAFGDAAHMWAGDVPFGASGTRASAGIGILAAVPRQSRSLARVDFAYPLMSDKNAKDLVIRFTFGLTGRSFWRESGQIARARLGTSASDIFTWP